MTRNLFLIAGVAGIAITSPAAARPDKADRGNDGPRAERVQQRAERPQMQRQQRAERPQMQRQERAERPQMQRMQRAERPQRQRIERAERPRIERAQRVERAERPQRNRIERAERPRIERAQRIQRVDRAQRVDRRNERVERRALDQRLDRIERRGDKVERRALNQRLERIDRRDNRIERRAAFTPQGLPHLLGRHDMRPIKDVKVKDRVRLGERLAATAFAPVPTYYRTRFDDTPNYYYRYDNDYGYVYRVNRSDNLVSALLPLFGGYNVGDPFPMTYRSSYVPMAYQPFYYDTPDYRYRYDGNAIYRIDAGTGLIAGIVALLTGNQFGVGQILPTSYNTYNVPLAYRSSYYDTNDAWYRYGDGYIYQVDPYSRRIEASYPLYGGYDDYVIGQRWPTAYPGYNVPYAYRDTYYDTPEYHYRYANGAIYRVDPTTQLISAIAALVTGNQFSVGQPLPTGYSAYNVPFAYRDRYYDTASDWYRYNDGYVYRVDARSGLIEDAYPIYA